MLEEQVIPRLLAQAAARRPRSISSASTPTASASRTPTALLTGVEALAPDGSVKLGFRAHYPQLETKLTVARRGHGRRPAQARAGRAGGAQAPRQLHPRRGRPDARGRRARRARRGARARWRSSRRSPSGQIAARLAHLPGAEKVFRRGIVARDARRGVRRRRPRRRRRPGELTREAAEAVGARRARGRPARRTRSRC